MIYIVFGVSGIGKTTIGKILAWELNIPFFDADDFHPTANVAKMKGGNPLNDKDRAPWLGILAKNIQVWNENSGAVLACSALKEDYRRVLQSVNKKEIKWIFLNADMSIISERLAQRENHYMNPKLLQSQFDTLEIPNYGIQINVNQAKEQIMSEILEKLPSKSVFGLIGLGVMGKSLALNIAGKNVAISVYNRHVQNTEVGIAKDFVNDNSDLNILGFDDLRQFINSMERPRNILLMVNAGKPVDAVIEDLLPHLDIDDLIIDGGNSHFLDTKKRIEYLKGNQINFIGIGVSGGEEGALKGPSIMPSGSEGAYNRIASILESISAKDKKGNACCTYIGNDGSGHFIKMIHNGIEYAEMQILAEIYHLLRFHVGKNPLEIAAVFDEWKQTGLNSYLIEITIDILRKKENADFLIDKILDQASQKGTGGWSTNAALDLGKPINSIAESVMARYLSAMKPQRVKASELYNIDKQKVSLDLLQLKNAYKSSRIINHAIGFDIIQEASNQYNWNLNLSEIARIWTNGCIIRSELMEQLVELFKDSKEHLLLHPTIVSELKKSKSDYAEIVSSALKSSCTVPVLSSALNYFLGLISEQSSANMIQAQRDYFGAHTYKRIDKPFDEAFHTNWK